MPQSTPCNKYIHKHVHYMFRTIDDMKLHVKNYSKVMNDIDNLVLFPTPKNYLTCNMFGTASSNGAVIRDVPTNRRIKVALTRVRIPTISICDFMTLDPQDQAIIRDKYSHRTRFRRVYIPSFEEFSS